MKILKSIGIILLYIICLIAYMFLSVLLNFRDNIILSGILIAIFLVIILKQGINVFKRYKGNSVKVNFLKLILNIIVLFILFTSIVMFNDTYKMEDKSVSLYATILKSEGESEEYNNKFKSLDYKSNKIFYTEEQESIIDLIKQYIDEGNEKNIKIFGDFDTSTLSIKLDYDKDVFYTRSDNDKVGGYYLVHANSMYLSVEDPYKDVLLGYNLKNNFKFKETFLHEYTHHIVYEFMEKNNIDISKVPIWFIEGISEYVGTSGNTLYEPEKILSFDKLSNEEDWNESLKDAYVYLQSNYAVSKIANENGDSIIKDILLNIKDMDFDEAFNNATGMEFKEFEKMFIEDFKNGFVEYYDLIKYEDNDINDEIRAKCYEKYLESNDNIEAYKILSNIYNYSFNNYEDAVKTIKKGIKKYPTNAELWRYLAIIYEENGKYDLAEEAFAKEKEFLKK